MKNGYPGRKESIILTAIEIISDLGIQGLSTKELAGRQDITESLLYRHFKSKDEILVAVLVHFSQFDQMIMNTVLKSDSDCKTKIKQFIRLYVEYYENYPAITAILHSYHQFMNELNTKELIKEIFFRRNNFLSEIIESGKQKGEIDTYFSAEELTDIILGLTKTLTFRWRIENYSFSLKKSNLSTLEKILAIC